MRRESALVLAVVALLAATAARADWKKDYDRGVKAAEAGNWAEAASAMRAAIAEDAEPSARKRFQGVVYKVYVPHHYAGLAAYRQGDCAAAMQLWNNAANARVVAGIAALDAVQGKGVADCSAKLAAAAMAPPPVAGATVPATRPPAVIPATAGTPPNTSSTTATTSRPANTASATPVAGTASADRPASPARSPETAPARPAAGPAPAALLQSADAFAQGRYAIVVGSDPASFGDVRAKAQGYLLRAAARFTQAQLAGGQAGLEQARADVRAARAANAALMPDEVLFSPKFRSFWSATR